MIYVWKKEGLYQNWVIFSLTFTQKPGYYASNCKMVSSDVEGLEEVDKLKAMVQRLPN